MRKSGYLSMLLLGVCWNTQAFAQTTSVITEEPQEIADTGDIVVTANRTESLASKTPLALTAISGSDLSKAGITSTSNLAEAVPNLVLATVSGGLQITIRGVTNEEATEKGDPSAAFLIDSVYMGRPQAVEVGLFDIARVEVLRGPQGTLFGRNTTAGVVHAITNRPSYAGMSGSMDAAYGNYNEFIGTGVINLPVSADFAIRAAVNYERRDNYVSRGPAFTARIDPFKENIAGRLQAAYRWSSGEVILRGDYADIGGRPYDHLALNTFYAPTVTGQDPLYLNKSTDSLLTVNAPHRLDQRRDNTSWGVAAEIKQNLGDVDLTYVGSYRRFDRSDTDSRMNAADTLTYRLLWTGSFRQQSHELRAAYGGDGPLKVQVGGYYFKEDISQTLWLLTAANIDFLGSTTRTTNPLIRNVSYAGFGQATYSITDKLRITAGARYSVDDKTRPGSFADVCDRFDCSGTVTRSVNSIASTPYFMFSWLAGFDLDLNPSLLLFASVATGYKAGGFNDGCELGTQAGCTLAAGSLYYVPETITSYEGGLKGRIANGAIRFNLNAFHYDYSNMQLSQIIANCGGGASCTATTNAGRAKVDGVELDGVITLSPKDKFTFGASYLHARFAEFRPDATYDFSGRPLGKAPQFTISTGYDHTFQLSNGGTVQVGARTTLTDEYFLISIASRNYYRQPSISRTDANITYTAPSEKFYVSAYIKNIENHVPVTAISFGVRSFVQTQAPRTYGVRAGLKF